MAKKKVASGKKDSDGEPDFESSIAEVEKIVTSLESGELGLAESLDKYEYGIKQLKRCHALLDAAEQKITLLSGFDADGNPITEAMGPAKQRTGKAAPTKRTIDDEEGLF